MTVSTDQGLTANAGAPSTLDARAGASAASPPAWHPDPTERFPLRYWDGSQWTANVVNADRQVGIDRGWAEAVAAASGRSSATPTATPTAMPAAVPAATPAVALSTAAAPPVAPSAPPTAPATATPASPPSAVPASALSVASAPSAAVLPTTAAESIGATGATPVGAVDDRDRPDVDADVDADGNHATYRHEVPVERFDISPAAVMGRRSTSAPAKRDGDPAPAPDDATGEAPTTTAASGPARRWARPLAATGPSGKEPEARPGVLTRIGGVKVLAVAGVALVVLVVGLGLAWASASRSYDAQEAWQQRADEWEERAGEHANERDEAIARIGRSRGRNRELNEENAEQQRQIEDLAADNAALTDENRLLNDALNSLGYELAP